ncbi:MAG: hypothetical protein J0I18_16535, partial [Actinobacteria bacterium]|nr:hypothetical protein [Actinomycetota bacterium]
MGAAIVAVAVDGIAAALAARPGATLVVGVRRAEGRFAAGAGAGAAERVLGIDTAGLAAAVLASGHAAFATGVAAVPSAHGIRRVVLADLGELAAGAAPSAETLFGAALAASRAAEGP